MNVHISKTITLQFLFITLLLSLSAVHVLANHSIERVSDELGYENQIVEAVFEDSYGFIWAGTYKGVMKYDGVNSFIYDKFIDDSVLSDLGVVYAIDQLSDEYLLMATSQQGLIVYNYKTDVLKAIPLSVENKYLLWHYLHDVEVDADGNIYLASNGVIVLDKTFQVIDEFHSADDAFSGTGDDVFDVFISSSGDFYAALRNTGVFKQNRITKEFERIYPLNNQKFENEQYYRIAETKKGGIVFTTRNQGVVMLDRKCQYVRNFIPKENGKALTNAELWSIYTTDHTLWFGGIMSGIYAVDLHKDDNAELIPFSLNVEDGQHLSVTAIISDQHNNIWLGTHFSGLVKINTNSAFRSRFKTQPNDWLKDEVINYIYEADSVLWIGTNGNGLFYYDRKKEKYGNLTVKDGLSSNTITDIEPDNNGNLWLSTWLGGISVLNPSDYSIKSYTKESPEGKSVNYNNIKDVAAIDDTLWISAHCKEINLYIPDEDTFIHSDNPSDIPYNLFLPQCGNVIYKCSKGIVWVASTVGLYAYKHGDVHTYVHIDTAENSLYDNHISDIYEDNKNRLWIGTNNGLQYFTPDRSEIIRISKDVVSKGITAIKAKSESELYLGTQSGLYIYNTEQNSAELFLAGDGLPSNTIRDRAIFVAGDGTVYVGTDKGFAFMNPVLYKTNSSEPFIFINSFEVKNPYNDIMCNLHNVLADTIVELDYSHSSLKLNYGAMGVPDIHKAKFSYKLEGLDELFHTTSSPDISYSRLEPGEYTLVINANYKNKTYSRYISILVHPPFWQTTWFIALMIFTLLLVLYFLYSFRVQVVKKQKFEQLVHEQTKELKQQNVVLSEKSSELENAYEELKTKNDKLAEAHQTLLNKSEEIEDAYNELKMQSDELEGTNNMLASANETQQKLVSALANDVNKSFDSVAESAGLLKKGSVDFNKHKKSIDDGIKASRSLINNLLSWAQSKNDRIVVKQESEKKPTNTQADKNGSDAVSDDKSILGVPAEGFMLELFELIEIHYSDPNFSVEKLAKFVGMTRSHLYRKIKTASNHTPIELIVAFRLEKAKQKLLTKEFSISEVAYMVGFNDPSYFSKMFKKHFEKTPTEMMEGD